MTAGVRALETKLFGEAGGTEVGVLLHVPRGGRTERLHAAEAIAGEADEQRQHGVLDVAPLTDQGAEMPDAARDRWTRGTDGRSGAKRWIEKG
eukprot:scaffold3581_cov252-Pinguiococcus_pyrenoidosus.AAC.26